MNTRPPAAIVSCLVVLALLGIITVPALHTAAQPATQAPAQQSQQAQQDQRPRIGISRIDLLPALAQRLEAEGKSADAQLVAESLDSQLTDRMHNTRRFRVIARQHLNAILDEQDMTPVVNPDQAPEQFQIDAVDYLAVTVIDHYEDRTEAQQFANRDMAGIRRTIEVGAVVMLYDTQTGEQLESANVLVEQTHASLERDGIQGDQQAFAALGRQLGRELSQRVASRVVDVIYPARVVAVQPETIIINRGDGTDIAPGETWTVYSRGEELIDPDLGISLGHAEQRVGSTVVTRVEPMVAYARIVEDHGIENGAMVRRSASENSP